MNAFTESVERLAKKLLANSLISALKSLQATGFKLTPKKRAISVWAASLQSEA